jgi:hypothetical protein
MASKVMGPMLPIFELNLPLLAELSMLNPNIA